MMFHLQLNVQYMNMSPDLQWTNLCNHLPGGGGILTGLDAKVPPSLQDIHHGLCWDVKAGRPMHVQLTRVEFFKAQLLPRLQWNTWKMNIILLANNKAYTKVLGIQLACYTDLGKMWKIYVLHTICPSRGDMEHSVILISIPGAALIRSVPKCFKN